ncbi:hypothetical protein Cal7507_4620 [Calothrix sp. PCC 7507]|nr:hypothetical protein Cal7507_4620 [Calothrix sp. PCC 7507]
MVFKDAALLTFISTAACLAFPKLLSIILDSKRDRTEGLPQRSSAEMAKLPITSFPYCTAYVLTGSQNCKFSPHFCGQCSPN